VNEYSAIMDRIKAGNVFAFQDATVKMNEMRPIMAEITVNANKMSEAQAGRVQKILEKFYAAGFN
jgi:hypothetical protein